MEKKINIVFQESEEIFWSGQKINAKYIDRIELDSELNVVSVLVRRDWDT